MRKLLIVVDMQKDFVDGSLGTKEAVAILSAVKEKIEGFAGDVIYTMDTHEEDYLDTQEGRNLPVKHCIRGTEGHQIHESLAPLTTGALAVFEKPAFGSRKLAEFIRELDKVQGVESIELVGLCTDICVVSNALIIKAFVPHVPVSVDSRCCAGVTPESHDHALAVMKACQVQIL